MKFVSDINAVMYEREVIVTVADCDFLERMKPNAVLQYFQDVASEHANLIGAGREELLKKDLCWILSRTSYRIIKTPVSGQTIKIKTFPEAPKRVECIRNYVITDSEDNEMILGTSRWCLIGISDKAIKRCEGVYTSDKKFIEYQPIKEGNIKVPAINTLENAYNCGSFFNTVGLNEIDTNRHKNNATYATNVFNALEMNELDEKEINGFDINYISEAAYKSSFNLIRADLNSESYFEGLKADDESPVFRAKIEWKA